MSEGRSIGKSRASGTGAWEIVVGTALQPGTHVLGLTATDGAGRRTTSTDLAVVAVPPETARTLAGLAVSSFLSAVIVR